MSCYMCNEKYEILWDYIKEENDIKGETWRCWFPLTPEFIQWRETLLPLIETLKMYEFEFGNDPISEESVDVLVKFAREGYMESDSKIKLFKPIPIGKDFNSIHDYLFKMNWQSFNENIKTT